MFSANRILVLSFVLQAALLPASPQVADAQQVTKGVPLDSTERDQGYVEGMDAVLAREAARTIELELEQNRGVWAIPTRRSTYYPHSGKHNLVNKHGDTLMGIGFNCTVDVIGFYVAGQSTEAIWAQAIRVNGYRDGELVEQTEWFDDIDESPAWMDVDLDGIDRIEIEAVPSDLGVGFYALDDLTYVEVDGSATPGTTVILDFEDCNYHERLSGSDFAGLSWELGTGRTSPAWIVPAPRQSPDSESDQVPRDEDVGRGVDPEISPPALLTDFEGVIRGDAGSFASPPDTHGAIGPNHFVEVVNRNFAVFDRNTGTELMNVLLGAFLPGSNGDPRVIFDNHSERWVVIVSDFDYRIFLAVSMSDDPLGAWYKTSVLVSTADDAGCFPDYPTLGANAAGIYVSAYMVGCGGSIFAFEKAPLVADPPGLGTVTAFRNLPSGATIQPAVTYGSSSGQLFVSRSNPSALFIRQLSGPITAPTLNSLGSVVVPQAFSPPNAAALGSTIPLNTVDSRAMNAVYRNGSLWTCDAIWVNGRSACQWYEIDMATQTVAQEGYIDSPIRHYFFPSIAVNAVDQVVMGFSGSSPTEYAGAYYSGRIAGDPPGMMSQPIQYRTGQGALNVIDGFGRNRFGDYSYTSVDPVDDLGFWTIQEFAYATDTWGTHVAAFRFDCNGNGIDDEEDVATGSSLDCNHNDVPDECEADCNASGVPDDCDLLDQTSFNCNSNALPDECELANNDCNEDAIPDDCQLAELVDSLTGPIDVSVCRSTPAQFSVSSSLGGLTYQWLRAGIPLVEGVEAIGTNTATLTIPNADDSDEVPYSCVVNLGCISTTTGLAMLSVSSELSILQQPNALVISCSGNTATVAVVAEGENLTYEWTKDGIPLQESPGEYEDVNTSVLQIIDTGPTDQAAYACIVRDACGNSETSTTGLLQFGDSTFASHPSARCASTGDTVSYSATTAPGDFPVFQQWYKDGSPMSDGGNISGVFTDTLVIQNAAPADEGSYAMRALSFGPNCIAFSDSVELELDSCVCGTPGDMDTDGDVDLVDYQRFTECFGANVASATECACANVDDMDETIDLNDWTALEAVLSGP